MRWLSGGIVAAELAPVGHRIVVTPSGGASAAAAPYDDGVAALLSRRVPSRLAPAIGLCSNGPRVFVVAQRGRLMAERRWAVWQPGRGLVHPAGLTPGRLHDLVAAAGCSDPGALGEVADILHDPAGDAADVIQRLLRALRLPGAEVVDGAPVADLPGGQHVSPTAGSIRRFDKTVGEERSWDEELASRGRAGHRDVDRTDDDADDGADDGINDGVEDHIDEGVDDGAEDRPPAPRESRPGSSTREQS